jgi:2-methylaconitate cis-trans-isomerase PrpF
VIWTHITRRSWLISPRHIGLAINSSRIPGTSRSVHSHPASLEDVPNPLPATFVRGGTSKGIFINSSHLPEDRSLWKPIFLGLMGSPDPYSRQLNGMGGGISSLSKICVVGPPSQQSYKHGEAHVDYTFVQVGIKDENLDFSGNCGNLSSMIGVFALDERIGILSSSGADTPGILNAAGTHATIYTYNTNTQKVISTTFPIDPISKLAHLDLPETAMAGVPGKASEILMKFHDPAGARTGLLLPSPGNAPVVAVDTPIHGHTFHVSLIDATNPTVFVALEDLCHTPTFKSLDILKTGEITAEDITPTGYEILETLRQWGSRKMKLIPVASAQPKISILHLPRSRHCRTQLIYGCITQSHPRHCRLMLGCCG